MIEKLKGHQRMILVILIAICMGIILIGGIRYVHALRHNLQNNAIQNVMTVTMQQQQAFDNFISGDRERLHSLAEYFSHRPSGSMEEIKEHLDLFYEADADYMVINLKTGLSCSNKSKTTFRTSGENLDTIRQALSDNDISGPNTTSFINESLFGYYETFTFSDGVPALVQKGYDRSNVSKTFSLSFYNNQGFACVVNQNGDILLRSSTGKGFNGENIFDMLTGIHGPDSNIDSFMQALDKQESGSITFSGATGQFLYTYVPLTNIEEWYLVSVVPTRAITEEMDHILLDSQMALSLLALVLLLCVVFVLLIWRTHKVIEAKNQEVEYQARLFDVFVTYLSRNTDDVYMMLDQETEKMEYMSPNVERVFGIKKEAVISFIEQSDLAADPQATAAYYKELNALAPGEAVTPRSTERINPKTGEHKYFLENAYCADIQGRRKRVAYISDRTKERKVQDSLAEALHMAQAANRAKSAFLSNVSHDIRTPMNAIIGFLSLLRGEADNPEMVLEYTQRIDAASQHLLGLINDVLDMNKIESGSATLNISDLNLVEVVEEINTIIRPQTKAKDQTFDISISFLSHEHLMGDKLRLNQILINLLSNSVKYTPEGGSIQLRVEELPQVLENYSRIRFTVADNGMGMSQDYLKVIFDPFTREEAAVARQIQGTGLGMAITKSLVDLMDGTIHVESELDKGSTFTVELELRIQAQAHDPKFWNDHKAAKMKEADIRQADVVQDKHILVVDDIETNRLILVKILNTLGAECGVACNGQEAVDKFEASQPGDYDLILMDVQMPVMDGYEATRTIRSSSHPSAGEIPIIAMTANAFVDDVRDAIESGMNAHIAKPIQLDNLKTTIRQVLDSRADGAEKPKE